MFLWLKQKFKMATKNGRKSFFGTQWQMTVYNPVMPKIFEISLSHTIYEINCPLVFYTEIQDGCQI